MIILHLQVGLLGKHMDTHSIYYFIHHYKSYAWLYQIYHQYTHSTRTLWAYKGIDFVNFF